MSYLALLLLLLPPGLNTLLERKELALFLVLELRLALEHLLLFLVLPLL